MAGLPAVTGLVIGGPYSAAAFASGFDTAMLICAGLLAAGAALSALFIDNGVLKPKPGRPVPEPQCRINCPLGAPPLEAESGEVSRAG